MPSGLCIVIFKNKPGLTLTSGILRHVCKLYNIIRKTDWNVAVGLTNWRLLLLQLCVPDLATSCTACTYTAINRCTSVATNWRLLIVTLCVAGVMNCDNMEWLCVMTGWWLYVVTGWWLYVMNGWCKMTVWWLCIVTLVIVYNDRLVIVYNERGDYVYWLAGDFVKWQCGDCI